MSCQQSACQSTCHSCCNQANFNSNIECQILHSIGEPISIELSETITVNNEIGMLANKIEHLNFCGPIPIEDYPINKDFCPTLYQKQSNCIECSRDVEVKYLEPGKAPSPGPIIINQAQNILAPPAPPVIIRQVPETPSTPPALVLREAPPERPQPPNCQVFTIPGTLLPPPPRKLVVERLPELPAKPQNIQLERWLPFQDTKRKVILNPKPADPIQCQPRNIIVNWEQRQCCSVKNIIRDAGVTQQNPDCYRQQHGCSLLKPEQLPEIACEVQSQHQKNLAANNQNHKYYHELEGDLHGLDLLVKTFGSLDAIGLGEYSHYVNRNGC